MDKLDGENWTIWKCQMKSVLRGKHLWGYVDGSKTAAADANDSVREAFQDKVDEAHMLITMAIGRSQMYLVTSCETAADAWKALTGHFEHNT